MTTAFHNDPVFRSRLLAELARHREEDRIIAGTYGEEIDGKWRGCDVGCSIRSLEIIGAPHAPHGSYSDHAWLADRIGWPLEICELRDAIFEGLPAADRVAWPERVTSAARAGADLSEVWPRVALAILTDPEHGALRHAGECASAVEPAAALYRRMIVGDHPTRGEWRAAARATAAGAAEATARAAAGTRAGYWSWLADELCRQIGRAP